MKTLLLNGTIVNEGRCYTGSIGIEGELITVVHEGKLSLEEATQRFREYICVDCQGKIILPGLIDDQVHFRTPGMEHKGDIETESRAALAGGVTSYMDMPNTKPATIDYDALMWKRDYAAAHSWANYGFFFGGTNTNCAEVLKIPTHLIPGLKLFLGASTGNMLVDNERALDCFFAEFPLPIAIHSESEAIIRENREQAIARWGEDPPVSYHPLIRSEEACYRCTAEALERATKYGTQLHVLHLSTAKEVALFDPLDAMEPRAISAEVCVHHLWFNDGDYAEKGTLIKWNPAIKTERDREGLLEGVRMGRISVIATDHAPHLLEEKQGGALKAASGGPLIQYSLLVLLALVDRGKLPLELIPTKTAHYPAMRFAVDKRGFLREGYYADIVVIDPNQQTMVTKDKILSKCGWSPFEGMTFNHSVEATYLNGERVYYKGNLCEERPVAKALLFRH